jgi:hypothetical protein
MVSPAPRWSVDIHYSGYTTVEVEAQDADEAIEKGRLEAQRRLGLGGIIDPDGAFSQLVNSLLPWESCDTAEMIS